MKKTISVIGLGPVGLATARGFARLGFRVIGNDILKERVDYVNKMKEMNLMATSSLRDAVLVSNVSFVCVGTPTLIGGRLEMKYLKKACKDIGEIIKDKKYHIVVIRSTMFPGSLDLLRKIIKKSCPAKKFGLAVNPEFLREKTALEDFFSPCYIVVGTNDTALGWKVMRYYKKIESEKFVVEENVAQMIKYANNSFHALKVAFTNELASISKKLNVDSESLMALFCEDTQLNISKYYFKPGKAYDGRCLPKDLAVLQRKSKELKVRVPIINSISESNKIQKRRDSNQIKSNRRYKNE